MTTSKRWGVAGLVVTYLTQVIACAPRVRERPPHELAVAVEPLGSEVVVYEWNGEVVTGPVVSPTTLQIPRPLGHRSYIVRVSKPGYCPQYWITGLEEPVTTGGAPWLLFGPPISGEAAIVIGAVVLVLIVLALLAQDDSNVEWALTPAGFSGSLVEVGGDGCQ